MSLYDGLAVETAPVPELSGKHDDPSPSKKQALSEQEGTIDKAEWAAKMKMLQSQLHRSKATRGGGTGRGGRGASKGKLGKGGTVSVQSSLLPKTSEPVELIADDMAGEVQDEYDPLTPNSYDDIKREEKEREHLERERIRMKKNEMYQTYRKEEEEEERTESRKKRELSGLAAVPPPNTASPPPPEQSDDEMVHSALQQLGKVKAKRENPYAKNFKTSHVASNIMSKYGWQEGQGLGKKEQGISTALAVEKTSFRGGKIVNVAAEMELEIEEEKKKVQSLTELMKKPTKVILLQNMVGPGEVDDDLQPEVTEECTKYGEVAQCLIYEIPHGAPDTEAVRIFVQFNKLDSAIKAVIDLNGRFFGGRTVKAGFYDENRFSRFDLAPGENE